MKKIVILCVVIIIAVAVYAAFAFDFFRTPITNEPVVVTNFEECVAAGNPVMESYPRQCRGVDGTNYTEDIGNELEKDDLIRIESPRPNAMVASPLKVTGMARGNWFFEASFPVELRIGTSTVLAQVPAQAKGDWMTTEFVPFEATLNFEYTFGRDKMPATLILHKDNPSGLPEHEDELHIPVILVPFEQKTSSQ